jgi:Domain of unknown function (DUF1833)
MATLTEALAEVYASNPQDEVVLNTLELRHPTFVDDAGNPAPIRVVADYASATATLETDAPLNAGEAVSSRRWLSSSSCRRWKRGRRRSSTSRSTV